MRTTRTDFAPWIVVVGALALAAFAPAAAGAQATSPPAVSLDDLFCPAGAEARVGGGFGEGEEEPLFLSVQGPCTVTRQCGGGCTCQDVDISCTASSGGTCESGPGGSCGGWVKCTGMSSPQYCPTQQCPPPCGGAPKCSTHSQCTTYCSPDPPFCSSGGCCICV